VPEDFVDLSRIHEPVGKFLSETPIPSNENGWVQFELTSAQLHFFEENGYLTNLPILTSGQVDQLLNELNLLCDPKHPGHGLFYEFHANESPDPTKILLHALGAWRITEGFHDLVFHPAITRKCSQLLGEKPIRFWHDQLFCKPSKHGSCVAWHQDYSYWTRTTPLSHLTIHIALDDQTPENGCLHYVPGSHKWNLLPITDRHFANMDSIQEVLNEEQKAQFKPVPMLLKKGQATIHHGLTVHGSFENKSDFQRRATVVNVFSDGVESNTDEQLLDGVPVITKGGKMEGTFFPLIFKK